MTTLLCWDVNVVSIGDDPNLLRLRTVAKTVPDDWRLCTKFGVRRNGGYFRIATTTILASQP